MPEYETIVSGKTGDLYEKGNFDDFCVKIESWLTSGIDRSSVRERCYEMINGKWNSNYQLSVLTKIILK